MTKTGSASNGVKVSIQTLSLIRFLGCILRLFLVPSLSFNTASQLLDYSALNLRVGICQTCRVRICLSGQPGEFLTSFIENAGDTAITSIGYYIAIYDRFDQVPYTLSPGYESSYSQSAGKYIFFRQVLRSNPSG